MAPLRLRIKLTDEPQATYRLELALRQGGGAPTLADLQAAAVGIIPRLQGLEPAAVRVSLNRKAVLSTEPQARLDQLGLCSGDMLWVLCDTATLFGPGTHIHHHHHQQQQQAVNMTASMEAEPGDGAPQAPSTAAGSSKCLCTPAGVERPDLGSSARAAALGAGHMDCDAAAAPPPDIADRRAAAAACSAGGDRDSGAVGAVSVGGAAEGHLQDGGGGSVHEAADDEERQALDQALACREPSLSSSSALPKAPAALARALAAWRDQRLHPSSSASAPHQLLVLAVHAALTDRGFHLMGPPPQPAPPSPVSLDAASAPALEPVGTLQAQPVGTQVLAPLHLAPSGALTALYEYQGARGPTPGASGAAAAQQGGASARCWVQGLVLGPHLVLHLHTPGPAVGAALSQGASTTVTLDTRVHVHAGRLAPWEGEVDGVRALAQALGALKDLRHMWVVLQDELAGPAQHAACAALCCAVPGGLMGLPREVTLQLIMRQLQARELARLTCVCVELRHLGGETRLWEPLFAKEFPHASLAARQAAAQKGFQVAFALAWQARVEVERARRREAGQRMAMMHTPPYFTLPTPGQSFRPPQPLGSRHIVGGDNDRLPTLPGGLLGGPSSLMGAGAGMFSGPVFPPGVLLGGPSLVPRFGGVQGLLGPHVPPMGGLGGVAGVPTRGPCLGHHQGLI